MNTKQTAPRGIIFDCDGTLADTMPLHWQVWQEITRRHKLHFEEERFYALGGVPSRDILKMLGKEQGVTVDHIAVSHEKEMEYLKMLPQVEPVHTIVEVARESVVIGTVVTFLDITERKQAQVALLEAKEAAEAAARKGSK